MHDRLVNEVTMERSFARIIGWTFASADAFRRSVEGEISLSPLNFLAL